MVKNEFNVKVRVAYLSYNSVKISGNVWFGLCRKVKTWIGKNVLGIPIQIRMPSKVRANNKVSNSKVCL